VRVLETMSYINVCSKADRRPTYCTALSQKTINKETENKKTVEQKNRFK